MKRHATAIALALGTVLWAATQADAQLWFFPDFDVPSAFGDPSSYVSATYGRGLNDDSGKLNAYSLKVGRTGLGDRVSVRAAVGVIDDVQNEWTLGASVGVDLLDVDAATKVSAQVGVGWLAIDVGSETLTSLRFPVGIALKRRIELESATVTPWLMPRANIAYVSFAGASNTEVDFGASVGVGVTLTNGFGFHTAVDILAAGSTPVLLGAGAHYVIR